MAVAYSEAGSFTSRSTTGVDTIDIGFAPKAMILTVSIAPFSSTDMAADNTNVQNVTVITDGTTTRSTAIFDDDAADPTDTQHAYSTSILAVNGVGTTVLAGTITFVGTTAEINWTTISGPWSVGWWAIGGADVSGKVLSFTKTGTGSVGITGAGFQPKALFGLSPMPAADAPSTAAQAQRMIAFADDVAAESGLGTASANAVGTSDSSRILANTNFFAMRAANNGAASVASSITSLDADGFTINFATLVTSPSYFAVLCLGGTGIIAAKFVTLTGNATVGANTQTMGGLPFQPDAGIVMNIQTTTNNTNGNGGVASLGFFSSTLNQSSMIYTQFDGIAQAQVWEGASATGAFTSHSTASTQPYNAHGRVSAIGATSIDVTWGAGKIATVTAWSGLIFNLDTPTPVTGTMDASLGGIAATIVGSTVVIPSDTRGAGPIVCVT